MQQFLPYVFLAGCLCCLLVPSRVVLAQTGLTESQKQAILDMHNQLRRQVNPPASNMEKMEWSDELATVAQNHANRCQFRHNGARASQSPSFQSVGENLAASTGAADYTGMVQDWYDEEENYNYNARSCSGVCGHYTQVVWAKSRALGCGVRRCSTLQGVTGRNWVILVCNYGPAGNFIGQRPYQSGSPCSSCPNDRPTCQDGLCGPANMPPPPAVLNARLTNKQKQDILDRHNSLRSRVNPTATNMKKMVWNKDLEDIAMAHAQDCAFVHNSARHMATSSGKFSYNYIGENLAATSSRSANYPGMVQKWYNEASNYNHGTNRCTPGRVCGHYTQVVWANSYELGCGALRCPQLQGAGKNWHFLVCNYGPSGNFNGQRPYQSGSTCSKCPNGCVNKLCTSSSPAPVTTTVSPIVAQQRNYWRRLLRGWGITFN